MTGRTGPFNHWTLLLLKATAHIRSFLLRLGHIYQDLIHTEDTVQELMERHGFFNQKLFYQKFKETYNCTPLQLRKMKSTGLYT